MDPKTLFVLCAIAVSCCVSTVPALYEAKWESLDARPLPTWFDGAKIGINIKWGIFAVPAFGRPDWFFYYLHEREPEYVNFMKDNYPTGFKYKDFAQKFTANLYNPEDWAILLKKSGVKFVTFTAREDDGYAMWPSNYSRDFNAMNVGPRRDLLGEFAKALRDKTDIRFGIRYNLRSLTNTLFLDDKKSGYKKTKFVDLIVMPELKELVEKYQPEVIEIIGINSEIPSSKYWKAENYLAWLYNDSPVKDTVVVNDLWAKDDFGRHGDFYENFYSSHKWYSSYALDKVSYGGYRSTAKLEDFRTTQDLITKIAIVVSGGGNVIFHIGPNEEGTIPVIVQERLLAMGAWLEVNGEAIYNTTKWLRQKEDYIGVYYTAKKQAVYAISTEWPKDEELKLKYAKQLFLNVNNTKTEVTILGGNGQPLLWEIKGDHVIIKFPERATIKCNWAYVVKIQSMKSRLESEMKTAKELEEKRNLLESQWKTEFENQWKVELENRRKAQRESERELDEKRKLLESQRKTEFENEWKIELESRRKAQRESERIEGEKCEENKKKLLDLEQKYQNIKINCEVDTN